MKSLLFLLILLGASLHADMLEDLSQGAQWIWTLGKGCPKFNATAAFDKLESVPACPSPEPGTGLERQAVNVAKIGANASDLAEDRLFVKLGTQQAAENKCGSDYAAAIAAGNPVGTALLDRLWLLRQARMQIDSSLQALANKSVATGGVDFVGFCTQMPPELPSVPAQCKDYAAARDAFALVRTSIPFAGYKPVQKMIDAYLSKRGSPEKLEQADAEIEGQLRAAYGSAAKDLDKSAQYLNQKVQDGGEFTRAEKYALLSDPAMLARSAGDDHDLQGLACRADARYGSGADDLATEATIGSLAFSGGLALAARLGASAAIAGATVLDTSRAVGLISNVAYRSAQMTLVALNAASATSTVDNLVRACNGQRGVNVNSGLNSTNQCVSAPSLSDTSADNCMLQGALTALHVASAALVLAGPIGSIHLRTMRAYAKLSPDEKKAILTYKGDLYRLMNDELRDGTEIADPRCRFCLPLKNALAKLPDYDGTAYRGTFLENVDSLHEGSEISDKGFSSASEILAQADIRGRNALLIIRSKSGKLIDAAQTHAGMNEEREVLFQPGARFRVTSIQKLNEDTVMDGRRLYRGFSIIYVDELP